MHDSMVVSQLQSRQNPLPHRRDIIIVHSRRVLLNQLLEVNPLSKVHHQPRDSIFDHDVRSADDPRVTELSMNPTLIEEAKAKFLARGEILPEDFQRVQALKVDVLDLPHRRKPAAAELLQYPIRTHRLAFS